MTLPLVSVIITTYNRPHYLRLAIESVLGQSYDNIEVIVTDDGGPGEENETVCSNYEGVQYHRLENSGGPARPRNFGLQQAKGEFIAFLDDDDIWVKDKLEKQVKVLLNNPEYILTHGYCEVIDENGDKTGEVIGRPGTPGLKHGDVSLRMMGNWTLMMPTPLLRTQVARELNGFNEEMPHAGEDTEFWVRCSFRGKFYYQDESLAEYRQHASQVSSNKSEYKYLGFYLYEALNNARNEGRVDAEGYRLLKRNLTGMALKRMPIHPYYSLKLLFKLDNLWIFRYRNIKLLLKVILGK